MHDTLIVGLGRIGMGYDMDLDPDKYVLTHARAFSQSASFKLCGGVDPSPECCELFQRVYSCPAFTNVEIALREIKPSVVVVAAPTEKHFDLVIQILKNGSPAAIICEKPISYDISEARKLVRLCEEHNCRLFVNYMRCSDVAVNELRSRILSEDIKFPFSGVFWYTKGLLNSASHLVNMTQYLFGEPVAVEVLDEGGAPEHADPEPDFEVCFSSGKVRFLALPEQNYFHNSLELMAANGRLRYDVNGQNVTWERLQPSSVFSGYVSLSNQPEILPSDFYRVQLHFTDQLSKALEGRAAQICDGRMALSTLEVLAKIKGDS